MRTKRLLADHIRMLDLDNRSELIKLSWSGNPPERYVVTYRCKGLVWMPDHSAPSVSSYHQMEVYLHRNYPRLPPSLRWLTPIFHPNILSPNRNGGVCIGGWTPSETLADLCLRIGEMVQYRNYSIDDPLDTSAAEWVAMNRHLLPVDARPLQASVGRLSVERTV